MKRLFGITALLFMVVALFFVTPAQAGVNVGIGIGVGPRPYWGPPRPWYYHHHPRYYYDAPVVYYTPSPSYVYVEQPAPPPVVVTQQAPVVVSTPAPAPVVVSSGSTTTSTTSSVPYGLRLSPSKVRSPYTNFTVDTHSPSGTVIYDSNTGQPFLVP